MTVPNEALREALEASGCERIKDFYSVGPVQKAALEQFLIEFVARTTITQRREAVIQSAVNKFLCWKLPQNFYPDSFIIFDREKHDTWGGYPHSWPTGTNLLTADQAKEMFAAVLPEFSQPPAPEQPSGERDCHETCTVCWGENGERWPCAKKRAVTPTAEPVGVAVADEIAWLAEYDGKWLSTIAPDTPNTEEAIQYLCVKSIHGGFGRVELATTHEANMALRFARKEDAELAIKLYVREPAHYEQHPHSKHWSAKEHMWPSASPAAPEAAKPNKELKAAFDTLLGKPEPTYHDGAGAMAYAWFGTPGTEKAVDAMFNAKPEQQAQAGEPTAEQMKQLLDGLGRCHSPATRYTFLLTWISDWTAAKTQSNREAMEKLAQDRNEWKASHTDAVRRFQRAEQTLFELRDDITKKDAALKACVELGEKLLAAQSTEAKALSACETALANFSDPAPERRAHLKATLAASAAEKDFRAAITKAQEAL